MTSEELGQFVLDQTIQAISNDDLAAFTQSVQLAEFTGLNILDFNYSLVNGNGIVAVDQKKIFATAFLSNAVNVLTWLCQDYVKQTNTKECFLAFLHFTKSLFNKVDLLDQESKMFKLVAGLVEDAISSYEDLGVLDQSLKTFSRPLGPIVSAMISKEKARTLAKAERETFQAEIQMPPAQADRTPHATLRM